MENTPPTSQLKWHMDALVDYTKGMEKDSAKLTDRKVKAAGQRLRAAIKRCIEVLQTMDDLALDELKTIPIKRRLKPNQLPQDKPVLIRQDGHIPQP